MLVRYHLGISLALPAMAYGGLVAGVAFGSWTPF